jgi:hypothetical protein
MVKPSTAPTWKVIVAEPVRTAIELNVVSDAIRLISGRAARPPG